MTPQQAGLPDFGRRQVPGLRREEVASLAGVSVEYHKRLERGGAGGVSDSVLDAIADALQLDDAERAHLFDLARAAAPTPSRRRRRPPQRGVRPAIQQMLASILAPATVSNTRGTPSSANSTSPTKSWNSPPTAACASPSSKPSPAVPPNSGLGTAAREYADACEGATIGHGLAVRGERVHDAADDIDAWLRRVRLKAG